MNLIENKIAVEYLRVAKMNFSSIKQYADKSIAQLNEDQMHLPTIGENNSIAIIMQHISGNLKSRFTDFLTSDGEKPNRNRDGEFEDTKKSKETLVSEWENSWSILFQLLETISIEDFCTKTVYVRSEAHTVLEAINRQVWHYSFHVGQIVSIAKQIKGNDWKNLSIPKGDSGKFNNEKMK